MARMFEIENSRKFGTRRELKLWLHGVRPVMTGMGSVGGNADVDGAAVTVGKSLWWLCMKKVTYGGN
jgi:hypothetical protein